MFNVANLLIMKKFPIIIHNYEFKKYAFDLLLFTQFKMLNRCIIFLLGFKTYTCNMKKIQIKTPFGLR